MAGNYEIKIFSNFGIHISFCPIYAAVCQALSINDPLIGIAMGDGSVKIYNVGDGSVRILNGATPVQESDGSVRVQGAAQLTDGSVSIGGITYVKPGVGSVAISNLFINSTKFDE